MNHKVLVSVLNWNAFSDTIRCVKSLLDMEGIHKDDIHISIIDNASENEDFLSLTNDLDKYNVFIHRNNSNLGFAGGHNLSIQHAIQNKYKYVWLLNNDSVVYKDTLFELIKTMEKYPQCGSCSPVIKRLGNPFIVDFCGAVHNWKSLGAFNPNGVENAHQFCEEHSSDLWLVGTALLLRVDALMQIGLLNEKLFAYFEDNDIGIRLTQGGWVNKMVFNSVVEHACFEGVITDRKPYYFYLMARNSFLFFLVYTPEPYRKFLRARLIDHSLVTAEKLYRLGHTDKAHACLLGIVDGLAGKGGPPMLNRKVPLWIQCLRPLDRWWNRKL